MAANTVYATELLRVISVGNEKVVSEFTYFVRGDADVPLKAVRQAAENENPGWSAVHSWKATPEEYLRHGKLSCIADDPPETKPKSNNPDNPLKNW